MPSITANTIAKRIEQLSVAFVKYRCGYFTNMMQQITTLMNVSMWVSKRFLRMIFLLSAALNLFIALLTGLGWLPQCSSIRTKISPKPKNRIIAIQIIKVLPSPFMKLEDP